MSDDLAQLVSAAEHTPNPALPHQASAWEYVQGLLTPQEHATFTTLYRSAPAAPGLKPDDPYTHWVTQHIQYGEVCIWAEPRRFTRQYQCDTCLEILIFLERVREHFGGNALIITSGHRPPAVNQAVGGAANSEHLYDEPDKGAIDFCIERTNIYSVERFVDDNWPYSVGYGASRGFVHVGIRPGRPRLRWDY